LYIAVSDVVLDYCYRAKAAFDDHLPEMLKQLTNANSWLNRITDRANENVWKFLDSWNSEASASSMSINRTAQQRTSHSTIPPA
jgi:hypothetical protein